MSWSVFNSTGTSWNFHDHGTNGLVSKWSILPFIIAHNLRNTIIWENLSSITLESVRLIRLYNGLSVLNSGVVYLEKSEYSYWLLRPISSLRYTGVGHTVRRTRYAYCTVVLQWVTFEVRAKTLFLYVAHQFRRSRNFYYWSASTSCAHWPCICPSIAWFQRSNCSDWTCFG